MKCKKDANIDAKIKFKFLKYIYYYRALCLVCI